MSEPIPRPKVGGKKVPLIAWIIGGTAAVGVVYYVYKRNTATAPTDTGAVDTSTQPFDTTGFGAGTPSAYGYYDPSTGTFITPGANPPGIIAPSTTQAWTQQALAYLSQQGIDTTMFLSGVANWLYGPNRLSQAEYTAVTQAIAAEGLPPGITTVPILAPANQTNPPSPTGKYHYAVELHKIGAAESGRHLVQRFSDASVVSTVRTEVALRATGADPRNAKYMPYYVAHGGRFPANAAIQTHVVKAG